MANHRRQQLATPDREQSADPSTARRMALTERTPSPMVLVRNWVFQFNRSTKFGASAHADVEVCWVESGCTHYQVADRMWEVSGGMVMVVPAMIEHTTIIEPGTRAVSVHLRSEMVEGVADMLGRSAHRTLAAGMAASPRSIIELTRVLCDEAAEGGAGSDLAVDALAEALVVRVLRVAPEVHTAASHNDPRIQRALQLAQESVGRLTVDDLATAASMSRFHFSRRFREVVGTSPYQYLLDARLNQAASLLRRGHLSVTESAVAAGFTEFGRFAAQFKRRFGCLPSEVGEARIACRSADSA